MSGKLPRKQNHVNALASILLFDSYQAIVCSKTPAQEGFTQ